MKILLESECLLWSISDLFRDFPRSLATLIGSEPCQHLAKSFQIHAHWYIEAPRYESLTAPLAAFSLLGDDGV
jgi:hypothetical protein